MVDIHFRSMGASFWEDIDGTEYFNVDEVEKIFSYIVFSMREGDYNGKIKDSNGNIIGEWSC